MCDNVVETEPCNSGACSRDCTLSNWTAWSSCSAACGGGVQERFRHVVVEAAGADGTCPLEQGIERYDRQRCNAQACLGDEQCVDKQDLVILLDQSAYVDANASAAQLSFVRQFLTRYGDASALPTASRIGIVLFGNGAVLPSGFPSGAAQTISPLQSDLSSVTVALSQVKPLGGFPNLDQAFSSALSLCGNRSAATTPCVVMAITGGRPPFMARTRQKAQDLWGQKIRTVLLSFSGTRDAETLESLASAPSAANFVDLPGWEALGPTGRALSVASCPGRGSAPRFLDSDCNSTSLAGCGTAVAAVRCCSSDGATCESTSLGCLSGTFSQARAACAARALRLCTPAELTSGVCCSVGCKAGTSMAWSSQEAIKHPAVEEALAAVCPNLKSAKKTAR